MFDITKSRVIAVLVGISLTPLDDMLVAGLISWLVPFPVSTTVVMISLSSLTLGWWLYTTRIRVADDADS